MTAEEIKQRHIELRLDALVAEALERESRRQAVSPAEFIQQALRHWLQQRGSGRMAAKLPRFPAPRPDSVTSLSVELSSGDWRDLEQAADDERSPPQRLLLHATLLLLADLDAGRVARRPDEPAGR